MPMALQRSLPHTLRWIAAVQVALGLAFALAPERAAEALGLPPAPGWAHWLLGMMAARCLAFGWGLWQVAKRPEGGRMWIQLMAFIQAVDWLVTLKYLALGAVTLSQVSTASFLPLLFILALWLGLRQAPAREATP
ncbi:hypothetical protein PSQ40_03830 [Curvibacter sp. HBC61]|uniref:Uncharacterized protein n=1 Tax=Curvibacter cyanobacteriorum TaxID=3026422 RepID=A0ABT5MUW4_9BURK|nr:hypothetical protein [Curvibacter sp. HBC61]MDD0837695.1 hypothetical protein [Curvibacter sp. HBC61]